MSTGIQVREQAPAFNVLDLVARHNGFINPGAPQATDRNQVRIGAVRTPIEHHNGVKRQLAGSHTGANPVASPSTRKEAVQRGRIQARDIKGVNYASHKGSGSNNKNKPIAGTDDVFNVGGKGGRSAMLVRVPGPAHLPVHGHTLAELRVRKGATKKNDPTRQPLAVHMGFNHVGYR